MNTTNKDKQTGFPLIAIIALVVVVAFIGYTGYTLYNHNSEQTTTHLSDQSNSSPSNSPASSISSNNTSTASTASTTNYLPIKELGIKLKLSDDIKDLTYTYNNLYGRNYIHFMTNSIIATDPTCTANNDPLGIYTVYTSEQPNPGLADNQAGQLIAHVKGYYIYYHHSQVACSNSTAASKAASVIPSLKTTLQNAQTQ